MHDLSPFYFPFAPELMFIVLPLLILVVIWTLAIKGYALWQAARNGQKGWFIVLLLINTLGILEIIYLIWFRSDKRNTSHPVQSSLTPGVNSSPQV